MITTRLEDKSKNIIIKIIKILYKTIRLSISITISLVIYN